MSGVAARWSLILIGALMAMSPHGQQPVRVFAAGSLRAPLTAIAQVFEQTVQQPVKLTFGASGLLRDRIAAGEPAEVFASANLEHPAALAERGWSGAVIPFARNQLCALAGPDVPLTTETVLDVLLDPQRKLGTSTPKVDPSGDYAWEVFRRADAVRPGSFDVLSAKAMQLTGGPQSPPPPADRNVYGMLVESGEVDVFLTYCTNAHQAIAEQPSLHIVPMPASLRVGAVYGVVVRRDAPKVANAFAAFLTSALGQRKLAQFGFDRP
jgi:ABC-type molybdate transport system substrate-binding protein